jgi:hypothetical protein
MVGGSCSLVEGFKDRRGAVSLVIWGSDSVSEDIGFKMEAITAEMVVRVVVIEWSDYRWSEVTVANLQRRGLGDRTKLRAVCLRHLKASSDVIVPNIDNEGHPTQTIKEFSRFLLRL